MVAGNTLLKFFFGQMLDQLREDGAARVHPSLFHPEDRRKEVNPALFQFKSFLRRSCVIMLIFNGLEWPPEILVGQQCQRTQSQTFIQFAHQQQTTVGSDPRTLEIYSQRRIKRELKRLILFLTHWVEASTMLIVLSKPHEYWRWPDHTTTYTDFKKEMWGYRHPPLQRWMPIIKNRLLVAGITS